MSKRRDPMTVRLCLWLVRVCSVLVPSRSRRDWRLEWEGELQHRRDYLESHNRFDRRHQMDLLRRALGALPDAAWLRRQLTLDADIVHDVRHGLRMLWKSPGFSASAIFILAVGIGSTVAVLTLLDTLMFRPLPYDESERIVTIWQRRAAGTGALEDVAPANFLDWRERAQSFSQLAAAVPYSYDYTGGAEPIVLFGAQVTEGFWEALGMGPALGRGFLPGEHLKGGPRVAVISHRLWQRRLQGTAAAVNAALSLDGETYTVVGILPPDFAPQLLPRSDALDVFTPKVVQDHEKRTRGSAWWNVVARLRAGAPA
jgi:putative ABC transport system permease protein